MLAVTEDEGKCQNLTLFNIENNKIFHILTKIKDWKLEMPSFKMEEEKVSFTVSLRFVVSLRLTVSLRFTDFLRFTVSLRLTVSLRFTVSFRFTVSLRFTVS